jgi:hypothetical protein
MRSWAQQYRGDTGEQLSVVGWLDGGATTLRRAITLDVNMKRVNWGRNRLVTFRRDSGTLERRQRHDEGLGRRRRLSGYSRNTLVSTAEGTREGESKLRCAP